MISLPDHLFSIDYDIRHIFCIHYYGVATAFLFQLISYPEHSTDTQTVYVFHSLVVSVICGTKYSRVDQVKFAKDSLQRNFNLKKF